MDRRSLRVPSQAILTTPPAYLTGPNWPGSAPPFLVAPAPSGAKVLIKITYGWGSETLPTVTVARNVPLVIEEGCISTSAAANVLDIGSGDPAFNGSLGIGQCFYGTGAGGSSGGPVGSEAGGPLTLRVGRSLCEVGHPRLRRGWISIAMGAAGLGVHSRRRDPQGECTAYTPPPGLTDPLDIK